MISSKCFIKMIALFSMLTLSPLAGNEFQESIASFTPPAGWQLAEKENLPKSVKAMVVGKGSSNYPPSINLSTEEFSGSLKEYLKIVKKINQGKGAQWKDLGTVKTGAGSGSLSQVDLQTEWGLIRMMHIILLKQGTVYILTAAAPKEEFGNYYKAFFDSMRSFKITFPEKIEEQK